MRIKKLTDEERRSCHGRYRRNDLFRHWMPILAGMEKSVTHMDAVSLWYNACEVLRLLRAEEEFRDEQLVFIHSEMARTADPACLACVMAVVITCLMNATPEGRETERLPNDAICIAIRTLYDPDPLFRLLITRFFARNRGYDGERVVIAPSDPLTASPSADDMDTDARREADACRDRVLQLTAGLKAHFADWRGWEELWTRICMDAELLVLLKKVAPRKNDWELNQKMICNVVGMYAGACRIESPIRALNNALSGKQLGSYLSNHRSFGTGDAAFDAARHDKVKNLIKEIS